MSDRDLFAQLTVPRPLQPAKRLLTGGATLKALDMGWQPVEITRLYGQYIQEWDEAGFADHLRSCDSVGGVRRRGA